jgi:ATP-binding cassette subfamily F protein 3
LSGGEKNRLQFAYAELTEANLLILDEPTNHMDIVSREVIEDALWEFSGTILVVSHDRYLLEKIAERVVIVQDRGFVSFPGGFSEYVQSLGGYWSKGELRKARSLAGIRSEDSRPGLEQRITSLESEQRELERKIETAFDAGDHVSGRRLAKRLDRVLRQIDNLYDEWAR